MKIYLTDAFLDFMKKAKVTESKVSEIAKELANGLHDGELVRNELYKKRIPSPGQGKRDSNRGIVAVKSGDAMFFMDGWRKSDVPKKGKEIPDNLLETYKLLAGEFREMSATDIARYIEGGLFKEVDYD